MDAVASQVFRLPGLGEGLTEAELVQWLVEVGDEIVVDQAIAEVETAKSIVELPSPYAGSVLALHGRSGETLQVGAPVLEVGGPGAASTPVAQADAARAVPVSNTAASAAELAAYRTEEQAGSGNVLIGYGTSGHSGTARRRPRLVKPAHDEPVTLASSEPPAPASTATEPATVASSAAKVPAASTSLRRTAARSPLVRRLARDLGIDVASIVASGGDGAVTRADVLRASGSATTEGTTTGASAPAVSDAPDLDVVSRERMSMLRRTVSAKLSRSRAEIPEATVWVDVDVTALWQRRPAMAGPGERPASFTAILARYVLLALEEYPLLAGRIDGDLLVQFEGVNLGVAADTDRGLMVPVISRADRLSIDGLDSSLRDLTLQARSGGLPPERLRGSTLTLNNYGSFGIDGSAAIINHPEVAILGIGRVLERAWVVDGELTVRRIAQLSLVFDHRVCDGGYAAGFLRRIVDAIESPLTVYGRI